MKFSDASQVKVVRAWTAWALALLVLLTGALGTWVSYQYFRQAEQTALTQALDERTRASQGRATGFLALTGDSLRAMAGLLNAGQTAESTVFQTYARQLLRQQPEIMAVAFALNPASLPEPSAAVPETQLDSDGDGLLDEATPPASADRAPIPAGLAPLTVVVVNSQGPGAALGDGSALLNTDLAATPALKAALARSQVTPTVEYSGPLEGQWTALTPIGDQGALRGHLVAFLAPQVLLQNAVATSGEDGLARQLIDPTGTAGGPRLLYEEASGAALSPERSARLSTQSDVSAFGQRWTLKLTALEPFVTSRSSPLANYVLIGGSLITLVLAAFVFMVSARSARVQQLVNRRTAELSDAYQRLRDSEMMAMQSEKMSSLGQMVAGVAHEINTPLGFISSNVQLLRELLGRLRPLMDNQTKLLSAVPHWTRLSPEQKQLWFKAALQQGTALQQIRQEGLSDDLDSLTSESLSGLERLTDLVLTLKNFSRLDRSMIDEIDVNSCIEDTLKIAHNVIKQKADVVKDLQPLPKIRCNPSQLNQVLLNLITNAAHAIDRFGTVEILSRVEANEIRISVRDNGRGMDSSVLSRIFEPFFTTKSHGEGTGLGLAISQKIIEEHGGQLDVQSELGVGSKFTIRLPIAR